MRIHIINSNQFGLSFGGGCLLLSSFHLDKLMLSLTKIFSLSLMIDNFN